jgi:hypothetical protein
LSAVVAQKNYFLAGYILIALVTIYCSMRHRTLMLAKCIIFQGWWGCWESSQEEPLAVGLKENTRDKFETVASKLLLENC